MHKKQLIRYSLILFVKCQEPSIPAFPSESQGSYTFSVSFEAILQCLDEATEWNLILLHILFLKSDYLPLSERDCLPRNLMFSRILQATWQFPVLSAAQISESELPTGIMVEFGISIYWSFVFLWASEHSCLLKSFCFSKAFFQFIEPLLKKRLSAFAGAAIKFYSFALMYILIMSIGLRMVVVSFSCDVTLHKSSNLWHDRNIRNITKCLTKDGLKKTKTLTI